MQRPISVKNRLDEVKFRCFPVKRTLRRQECSPRRSGGERTVYLSCSTKRFPPSCCFASRRQRSNERSEEHTSELQSRLHLVCRLLLEKKKKITLHHHCYRVLHTSCMPDRTSTAA